MHGIILLLVVLGCYDSHDATGCVWEGRRHDDGEIWDRTMGHHFECRDGTVAEVTIFWDFADLDAGRDPPR